MFVHVDKPFMYGGRIYEIESDNFGRPDGVTFYTVYVYDETGEIRTAHSGTPHHFQYFYDLGWSKEEILAGCKNDWVIVKKRAAHLYNLFSILEYETEDVQDFFADMDSWEFLPDEEFFNDWLCGEFVPLWEEGATPEVLAREVKKFREEFECDPTGLQVVE